ncbi:MAG: hypothetical protein JRJ35_15515 [Deltaproteobacteria bacterium]|nr:hypothetical protein [Deltaproteobacteria bacterium]MBW1924873.1 hypothetical protein [Deltaproteobacteria bacterium]
MSMSSESRDQSGWRGYQARLQRKAFKRRLASRMPLLVLVSVVSFFVLAVMVYAAFRHSLRESTDGLGSRGQAATRHLQRGPDLAGILEKIDLCSLSEYDRITCAGGEGRLEVRTALETSLQRYAGRLLKRSGTIQSAVVALSPVDGRVLVMNWRGARAEGHNLCLEARFPAASLFKIVSAAAALEGAGLTPERQMGFEGRRYTLYRNQLKNRITRYTNRVSLKRAFALSINPVFGKLGIFYLGRERVEEYARRFLFNRPIPFDLPTGLSTIAVPEDPYGLAEITSGFNKRTLLSPLHAALMTAAVVNQGVVMSPWLVSSVRDATGRVLYRPELKPLASPIGRDTAAQLRSMMRETVRRGTCRRTFRRLTRKRAFRGVELGAKTGTINDRSDTYRYDWITAYALPADKTKGLCLAVLMVHGKRLGTRAREIARLIIDRYIN